MDRTIELSTFKCRYFLIEINKKSLMTYRGVGYLIQLPRTMSQAYAKRIQWLSR